MIAVGVITNKLAINELTFYNSIMTLCFFAEMFGFGFIEGFGIYINQNINNPEKSKKYARIGFCWISIFAFLFVLILCLFPNFIIKKLLGLTFEVNLTFYYLMVIGIFFSALLYYIMDLMKKVTLFKFQMICSIIQCALIFSGLILLTVSNNLVLILIGITYLATYLICLVVGLLLLNKNKVYNVNLFKISSLKLTKSETGIILTRTMSELVWEVGFTFISLFILNSNVTTYNQYCYFENALDILGGFLFAFFNVVSIKICRCIGNGEKKEALNHAKNSIISTFVLWLFYAVVSLSCFIPLQKGLNPELQNTAFVSLLLYVALAFFRYIDWNLGTYIIGQSEVYAKTSLIIETCGMFFWIAMYLVSTQVSMNIFLIYSIIAFESIVKIVINSIFIFKQKWLNKIDEFSVH